MKFIAYAAIVLGVAAFGWTAISFAEELPEADAQRPADSGESVGAPSPAPTNVPLPTERFKSFAAFPPSGSGPRVKLDDRRWVELIALASYGKIGGDDIKVFWTADGELIDPPADFDPKVLVPDQVDGEMPSVTREVLVQVVGPTGLGTALRTSGHGGYGRMPVPIDDEFEQLPLNSVMSDIGYNHAYVEVRVTGESWEEVSPANRPDMQWLTSDDDRRVYVITDNARDFEWRLDLQRDGEAETTAMPTMVGGTIQSVPESLRKSVAEDLQDFQVVAFFFQKDKPLPTIKRLKRSRYDVVRFDNLSVYPGPRSAVRVSVNGAPVSDEEQPELTEKEIVEDPSTAERDTGEEPLEIISLSGSVVDENGEPLKGCWVGMFTNPQEFDERKSPESEFDDLPEFAAEGWTTAEGKFAILAPKTHFVFDGSFWAVQRNGATGMLAMNATWEHTQRQLKIIVPEGEATVRVVDPNGNPVARADVTLEAVKIPRSVTRRLPAMVQQQQTASTDEGGRVTFRGWPPAAIRGLSVNVDGYGTQYLSDRLASVWVEGDEDLTIRLQPTAGLTGRVEGIDPQEHSDLKLQILTETRDGRPPLYGRAVVDLQDDGSFRVDNLAAGWVSFVSSLSPDSSSKIRFPSVPALQPGEQRVLSHNPRLESAVLVRQRIIKHDTGEPIPDMKLRVLWGSAVEGHGSWRQSKPTRTDKDGWWTAKVLPGRINIRIATIPKGYAGTAWFDGRNGYLGVEATIPAADQIVTLPPERYVPSKELTGRLQYADGSPAGDWSIYGHPISWGDVGVGGVHTKTDGSFSWTYPVGYPPRFYNARNREWMTEHHFKDRYVVPKVISTEPFVLEANSD